jgi:HK97 family phage portal protein
MSKLITLGLSELKMTADPPSTLANPSAGLIESLIGFPTSAGKVVTKDTAIRVASFLSGVKMLASDLAKMPLILRETIITNGRQRTLPALAEPLYSLLKDCPNQWMTSYQLRWYLAFQLVANGNCFCQIIRNGKGDVIALNPLTAWNMVQKWDFTVPGTPLLYWVYNDGRGNTRRFEQQEIWHTTSLNIEGNGVEGSAITALAKEALSVMMASDETAGRFFANGLGIHGFLTNSNAAVELTEPQAQGVIDRLKKDYSGSRNAGKFTYLPGGVKYEKMALTAVEGQLLESRKWNAEEVIRLLGGAPLLVKLGYGGKNSTYASSSAFLDEYFNTSLLPYTTSLEQTITRDLIAPGDRPRLFARHNADIMLRGSPRERAETYEIQIRSGQISGNEARMKEDMDTVEEWDKMFFPANSGVFDPETGEMFIPGQKSPDSRAETSGPDAQTAPPAQTNADIKTTARLLTIANSLAERVMRKEAKGSIDAKFLAEVMSVSTEQAQEYVQARKSDAMSDENARAALIAMATKGN